MEGHDKSATVCGTLAVIIWSASICLSRSLMEKLGMFTATGAIYLFSGIISTMFFLSLNRFDLKKFKFNPGYLAVCGIPFVLYLLCLYIAVGLAANREQVVEIGLINYLWPSFTLVFSIPILKKKAGLWLIPGMLTACAGIFIANISCNNSALSLAAFLTNCRNNLFPYLLALAAALLWGLYSNFACYYRQYSNALSVPLFLLTTGVLLEAAGLFFPEKSYWSNAAVTELAIMVLFPCITAYILWDYAMRRGNLVLVTAFAYFTPLFSTVLIGLYLGAALSAGVWIACGLIIAGAVICKFSISESQSV